MAFARLKINRVTEDELLDWRSEIVLIDTANGPVKVTLPTDIDRQVYTIKNIGSAGHNATVDRNGFTIDGAESDIVLADKESIHLVGNGTGWWIVQGGGM